MLTKFMILNYAQNAQALALPLLSRPKVYPNENRVLGLPRRTQRGRIQRFFYRLYNLWSFPLPLRLTSRRMSV